MHVNCPYCKERFIEQNEIICSQCEPQYECDLLLNDLKQNIENLKDRSLYINNDTRYAYIKNAIENLNNLLRK
jgi:hypothetical protein